MPAQPPPPASSSTREDALLFLESLDNPPQVTTSPGGALDREPALSAAGHASRGAKSGKAGAEGSAASAHTQAVLDFLDEIGESATGAAAPAPPDSFGQNDAVGGVTSEIDVSGTGPPSATHHPGGLTTASGLQATSPRRSPASFEAVRPHTSPRQERHPAASIPAENMAQKAPPVPPDVESGAEPGGWSWGGILAAGAKVVKSSEEALKKTSEAALKNVAAEREKVRGFVNSDALGKLGGDLRKITIEGVTSVVNTIAPPIPGVPRLPRLVCYVESSSMVIPGEEWMDACAFRMFDAALDECSPSTRRKIGYAGIDVKAFGLDAASSEKETSKEGHNAAAGAVKASLSRLMDQKPSISVATGNEEKGGGASTAPGFYDVYLAVEAFQFTAREAHLFTAYAAAFCDPARSIELITFSQATSSRLLDRLGDSERRDIAIECVEAAVKALWREWFDFVLSEQTAVGKHQAQLPQEQQI